MTEHPPPGRFTNKSGCVGLSDFPPFLLGNRSNAETIHANHTIEPERTRTRGSPPYQTRQSVDRRPKKIVRPIGTAGD
jgi:hypothetical protein